MFYMISATSSTSKKPDSFFHPKNAERRLDEAPRISRNGLDILSLDRFGEGWNFPEGSPIHSQNIIESNNLWSFRNPSPPIVPKDFENSLIPVKTGKINHLVFLVFLKRNYYFTPF